MQSNCRNVLERRRQNEEVYRSMDARMKGDRRALQIASFEASSMLKIDAKIRNERVGALKEEDDRVLFGRRQCLADLYNDEMDRWQVEIASEVETQEDRKARCIKYR